MAMHTTKYHNYFCHLIQSGSRMPTECLQSTRYALLKAPFPFLCACVPVNTYSLPPLLEDVTHLHLLVSAGPVANTRTVRSCTPRNNEIVHRVPHPTYRKHTPGPEPGRALIDRSMQPLPHTPLSYPSIFHHTSLPSSHFPFHCNPGHFSREASVSVLATLFLIYICV
ncbi:hypothetical protein LY78DRAFT_494517 [Colletotrichum sublineola]|nr:hypothetical protein LY78DRAFT_494517 [Colletotrichum sublineola]